MNSFDDKATRLLRQIADVLGNKVADFYDGAEIFDRVNDRMESLEAFQHLSQAEDRRSCIAFVQSVVTRRKEST